MFFHSRYETSGSKDAVRHGCSLFELLALLTVIAIMITYVLTAPKARHTDTWYKDPNRTRLDQTFDELAELGDGWLFDLHSHDFVTTTALDARNTPHHVTVPAPVALAQCPLQARGTVQLPRISGLAASLSLAVCGCGAQEFSTSLITAKV
jgi:hypothetical protein